MMMMMMIMIKAKSTERPKVRTRLLSSHRNEFYLTLCLILCLVLRIESVGN